MHLAEMLLLVVVESSYSTLGAPLDYYSQARRAALFSPRAAFLGESKKRALQGLDDYKRLAESISEELTLYRIAR